MDVLTELVAPLRCVGCSSACDGELCERCAREVVVVRPPMCERCGAPRCPGCQGLVGFERARSVVVYRDHARRLALALKRHGRTGLAEDMAALMAAVAARDGLCAETVSCVPGRPGAGGDHAELLAGAVAEALGRPMMARALRRSSRGPRQSEVPRHERRSNAHGRFAARCRVSGDVLLVDDIITTGATAEACALALLEAGARRVDVLTWARTMRRTPDADILKW